MTGFKRNTSAILATALLSLSAAIAGPAQAPEGTMPFCNSTFISIDGVGPANVYPSTIAVTGVTGTVSRVTVTLTNFAHEWPDDVNVLLVGPQGQKVVLLQDVGGDSVVQSANLTFDDRVAATLPDDGQIVSGTYRPTIGTVLGGGNAGGVYPAPAPAGPYATALTAFNGTDPNGMWQLFVYDDTNFFAGSVGGGWCLTIDTATACNSVPVVVGDGAASPYPSSVSVTGLAGTITKVTVSLDNVSHDWPDDLNVLLVGPQGQKVVLMQDTGGLFDVANVSLTFDDAAARFLPNAAEIGSGAYRPTVGTSPPDENTGGVYPAPAPAGPYATALSAFNGTNPNGIWQLFVYDDTDDFGGAIAGGWCLTIETGGGPSARDTVGLYVMTSGAFFLRNAHSSGPADFTFVFGAGGAVAVTGDWNGDGTDTPGLYVPSTGGFFLKNTNSSGPANVTFFFGPSSSTLVPIAGDWNGDGVDTIGLYDPTAGAFFLKNANANGAADVTFFFGPQSSTLAPVAGDWDGDGDDTVGLYNPAAGAFFLRNANANGAADLTFFFGAAGAGLRAIAGDWNGDGIDSVGLYTPSTGAFFLKDANANGAADYVFFFGIGENTPLAGNWDGN